MIKKIGKFEHIESGQVIAHSNQNVIIEISDLKFELIFRENPDYSETQVEATGGGLSLSLTFTNFNLGIGHVNTVPLPVGTLNGNKLYFNYAIYGFGVSPSPVAKLVHYTFFSEPNA